MCDLSDDVQVIGAKAKGKQDESDPRERGKKISLTPCPCHAMVSSCMCTVAFSELSHVGLEMDEWMDGWYGNHNVM